VGIGGCAVRESGVCAVMYRRRSVRFAALETISAIYHEQI